MNRILFISCTKVARFMIQELFVNQFLKDIQLVGVVNLNRKQSVHKAYYDDYFDLIDKYKFDSFYCNNINEHESLDWIKSKEPDLIIQSGWSQKFSDQLLSIPKIACIGEHPAPLPIGRGAACVNWAIINGETKWGDTFFRMVSEFDKGPIYDQEFFDIAVYDDVATVYDKVCFSSLTIFRRSVKHWLSGNFNYINQDESKKTYFGRRKPSDGEFDFNKTGMEVYNFIRAQTKPYPGAFFYYKNYKIKIWKANLLNITSNESVGSFIGISQNGGLFVICSDHLVVELLRVQQEDRPEQSAEDWFKEIEK